MSFRYARVMAVCAAVCTAVPLWGATTASAAPKWVPLPVPADQTLVGICPFPVAEHWIAFDEHSTYTTPSDGSIVQETEGLNTFQVTNTSTGATAVINGSGPGTVTFHPDGSFSADLEGLNPIPAGPNPYGLPLWGLYIGHLEYTITASGGLTGYSLDGHVSDICTALG